MRSASSIAFATVILTTLALTATLAANDGPPKMPQQAPAQRIVSLAPAFTEILYALGLGDRVVGVTRYCTFPPEAQTKPKIGGFATPELESIVAVRPGLVLMLPADVFAQLEAKLRSMGIGAVQLPMDRVDDILAGIREVARLCGEAENGKRLAHDIANKLQALRHLTEGRRRPKVLFLVGYDPLVVVGGASFINELIDAAGGENVAGGDARAYVTFSYERMLAAAPDVIINAAMGTDASAEQKQQFERTLSRWPSLPAVREKRIHVIDISLATVPGPRITFLAATLASLFHPDLVAEGVLP